MMSIATPVAGAVRPAMRARVAASGKAPAMAVSRQAPHRGVNAASASLRMKATATAKATPMFAGSTHFANAALKVRTQRPKARTGVRAEAAAGERYAHAPCPIPPQSRGTFPSHGDRGSE